MPWSPLSGLFPTTSLYLLTHNPKNLSEAFEHALHAEERHKYSKKNSMASSYHIAGARERVPESPRSLNLFSKKMDDSRQYTKSERSSLKENSMALATLRIGHNIIPDLRYAPSAWNKFSSPYPPLHSDYLLQYILLSSLYTTLPLSTSISLPFPPCYGTIPTDGQGSKFAYWPFVAGSKKVFGKCNSP